MGRAMAGAMTLVIMLIGLSGAVPTIRVQQAHACSCVTDDVAELLSYNDVVVRGEVTDVDRPNWPASGPGPMHYTVEITQVWIGDVSNPMQVATAMFEGACGLPDFEVADDVIIAGRLATGKIEANLCSVSGPATDERVAEISDVLGPPVAAAPTVAEPAGSWVGWVVGGVAAVMVVAAGVILVVLRRRRG